MQHFDHIYLRGKKPHSTNNGKGAVRCCSGAQNMSCKSKGNSLLLLRKSLRTPGFCSVNILTQTEKGKKQNSSSKPKQILLEDQCSWGLLLHIVSFSWQKLNSPNISDSSRIILHWWTLHVITWPLKATDIYSHPGLQFMSLGETVHRNLQEKHHQEN